MPRWNGIGKKPALHKHTAGKIREKYFTIWSQDWPFDDRYLNELWFNTDDGYLTIQERYESVLNAMRECDGTIPAEYGRMEKDVTL